MVNKHNALRDETVRGSHMLFVAMTMKPMKIVSYDKECEFLAGCHMKQCKFTNDKVRISLDDGAMGQIMYRRMVKDDETDKLDVNFLSEAFDMWIKKKKPKHVEIAGNIFQLAWVHTTRVGCAMMYYRQKPDKYYYSVICNYKPELPIDKNLSYELRYHVCTKRNKQYKKLCGFVRPLEDDDFTPPLRLDTGFASLPIYQLVAICSSAIIVLNLI
ncbi:PREDICTED: venom allergen 3-like [Nicrophorus vespilloides]|uniref:Venom allergen 3-like n=1 Tax=Nicrophorus vespilloides TaxID=110193 RepID=A0ABM1MM44_NICVS|nr:PREDICTED: venom allergen 3-like [Nicrophorus vespilloides]